MLFYVAKALLDSTQAFCVRKQRYIVKGPLEVPMLYYSCLQVYSCCTCVKEGYGDVAVYCDG